MIEIVITDHVYEKVILPAIENMKKYILEDIRSQVGFRAPHPAD
jgi:hypothetical protein